MSQALGSFLIGEEIAEADAVLPLAALRERFPLNEQAARIEYSGPDSDRVRLRRVRQALQDAGLKVSGPEAMHTCSGAEITLHGQYDYKGQLKGDLHISVSGEASDRDLVRDTAQAALQAERFAVIATYDGQLLDVRRRLASDGADVLPWLELGCAGQSTIMTLEEVEQWAAVHPRLAELHLSQTWYASGATAQQAAAWLEAAATSQARLQEHYVAAPWIDAGHDAELAAQWASAHPQLMHYMIAEAWIGQMPPEEAKLWAPIAAEHNFRPEFSAVQPLLDAGITTHYLQQLRDLDVSDRSASQLLDAVAAGELSQDEALAWAKMGEHFHRRCSAARWQARGIPADQARAWYELSQQHPAGYLPSDILADNIGRWIAAERSPEQAQPWVTRCSAFWDYRLVAAWEAEGETIESLEPWLALYDRQQQAFSQEASDLLRVSERQAWRAISPRFADVAAVERVLQAGVSRRQAELVLAEISG